MRLERIAATQLIGQNTGEKAAQSPIAQSCNENGDVRNVVAGEEAVLDQQRAQFLRPGTFGENEQLLRVVDSTVLQFIRELPESTAAYCLPMYCVHAAHSVPNHYHL